MGKKLTFQMHNQSGVPLETVEYCAPLVKIIDHAQSTVIDAMASAARTTGYIIVNCA